MMLVRFSDVFPLKSSRYHEVTGAGAYSFASVCCGYTAGKAIWFVEGWMHEVVNPLGLQTHCDPHQVLIGKCSNPTDVLAASEEALRSGVVSLVIAELTKPLSLTAGRRLQLAAEAGGSSGLMIVRDGMGSNATQTRWHVSPVYSSNDSTQMRWSLIKNKYGTCMDWEVRWDEAARRIFVVSQHVQRTGVTQAAL
jgi:protein ImuA